MKILLAIVQSITNLTAMQIKAINISIVITLPIIPIITASDNDDDDDGEGDDGTEFTAEIKQ